MAALLVWPGAVAIGLSLGLLGSGGSILTVPVLLYLVGQDEKVAIAGSLAIVGLIAIAGSVSYVRDRLVDWRTVLLFGVPGMAGTYLGAWSSAYVSGLVQLAVFAMVMLAAAYFMLKPQAAMPAHAPAPRPYWRVLTEGLSVGALTGFVGVGGGFLIVPALTLLGGLPIHRAIATSLVIIALKSAVGFVKYQGVLADEGLTLDYGIIGAVALLGVVGSLAGAHVAQIVPHEKLQRGFAMFLIVVGAFMLGQSLFELLG